MFHYASKFLPLFIYPLGLACGLLTGALIIKRESIWSKRLSLVALLLLLTGGNRIISTAVVHSLERQYPPLVITPTADVIVVLGGGMKTMSPPRLEYEVSEAGDRMLYAARLYHAGAAPYILVSGGQSKWTGPETGPEAEGMLDILQLVGVPENAIILEDKSSNTYENAVETVKILQDLKYNNIILVTSALHMPRSMAIFEKYELNLIPAPTDFHVTDLDIEYILRLDPHIQLLNLVPTAGNLNALSLAVKEYIGMVVYKLRGWM